MHARESLTDAVRATSVLAGAWDGHTTPRPLLNPGFSEAMLGFPVGWTDLGASETPSSPK